MSDEEDFDELPSITVNSNYNKSMCFSMPSAERLAAERAREEACARELRRAERAAPHSDSSGSEGEAAALSAAVAAMRVPPARAAPRAALPLLRAVLAHVPPPPPADANFLAAYLGALQDGDDASARALTAELGDIITGMVCEGGEGSWSGEEVLQAGVWLCCAAAEPRAPRAARRALHLLLDHVATDEQAEALSLALCGAALEPRAALELSDALRSGSERSLRAARALAAAALARLAPPAPPAPHEVRAPPRLAGAVSGAWRRLPPPQRYVALQLLARLLPPPGEGQGEGEEARRALEALAQAAPGSRQHSPDLLKVLVAATKLQVLFHVNK